VVVAVPFAELYSPRLQTRRRIISLDAGHIHTEASMHKLSVDERLTKLAVDMRAKAGLLLAGTEQLALLAKAKTFDSHVGLSGSMFCPEWLPSKRPKRS
jgi:hypothetical protein